MVQTTIKIILVNSRKANAIISTIKTNPKDRVQGKSRKPLSATDVVALITLQRSAMFSNTWLTCTRNS
jgi:hypothetical protein